MTTPACPTEQKKRYATREASEFAARRSQITAGQPLYSYVCSCTWWHLTRTPTDEIPADTAPDLADVERLTLMSPPTFRALAADEARGKAAMADRVALRHPDLAERWCQALHELRNDVIQQLALRAKDRTLEAHDWRRRARAYHDVLTSRFNEGRDIRAGVLETNKEARREAQQRREERDQAAKQARIEAHDHALDEQLDQLGVPPMSQNELRRQAGEKAIKRIIDAHGLEFTRYLAEECDAIGANIPRRVQRWLATTEQPLPRTA